MKANTSAPAPLAVGLLLSFAAVAQDHRHVHAGHPQTRQERPASAASPHPQHHHRHEHAGSPPGDEPARPPAEPGRSGPSAHGGAVPHAGHAATGDAPAAALPRTPIPPPTDADRAAAAKPASRHAAHDGAIHSLVLLDRLERFGGDDADGLSWEAQAWIGGDLNKLWLRGEGERVGGHTESADVELLYGRAIAPWWDAVVGLRHDFEPGGPQDYAAFGVTGLAPYKFEVAATAYLGESGRTAARIEVEYETLLTNRLILQPRLELEFNGRDDPGRGIGSGLGMAEAGLRLRYEFSRRFAPYVGVVRERAFGRTADFREAAGEGADGTRWVAGVRAWF